MKQDDRTSVKRGVLYPLADRLLTKEMAELDTGYRSGATVRAEWTGAVRQPKRGEWYLSGALVEAYRSAGILTMPFHIAKLVVVEGRNVGKQQQVTPVGGVLMSDSRLREAALRDALCVLVLDPRIRRFLQENDPKALEQAERALALTGWPDDPAEEGES